MEETFENSTLPNKKEEKKKHGKLLAIWLILIFISNIGVVFTYLLLNSGVTALYPNAPSGIFYIYGILGLANLVFLVFLFRWKKWSFWAYCASAGIAFILNLIIGIGIGTALSGLIGPIVLYLVLRPKWELLK